MAFDIDSIKHGSVARPPRMIIEGLPKIGKSTLASQAPKVVFLPIAKEEGIDDLEVSSFPTINSYDELMDAFRVLATSEHDFQTVCIDSVSALEPLIWKHVCDKGGKDNIEDFGYGKGFTLALDYWRYIQGALDHLRTEKNMGSILIGHVISRTFQDPMAEPYDRYDLDLNKKAVAQLQRWADFIGFAGKKVYVREKKGEGFQKNVALATGGDKPVLFTQSRPQHDGGGRGPYGQLPYELELNYDALMSAVKTAMGK